MDEQTYQRVRAKAQTLGGMAEIERSLYRTIFQQQRVDLAQARKDRDEYRWLHEVAGRCLRDRDYEIAGLRQELSELGVTPRTPEFEPDPSLP